MERFLNCNLKKQMSNTWLQFWFVSAVIENRESLTVSDLKSEKHSSRLKEVSVLPQRRLPLALAR